MVFGLCAQAHFFFFFLKMDRSCSHMGTDVCTEVNTCTKIIQGVHVGPILFNAGLSPKGTFNVFIYAFYVFRWFGE